MTIKTERLIIRPTSEKDIDKLHQLLSDEDTMRFFVEGTYSKEKVKEIINRNKKETHHFTVLLKSSNRMIGKISFNPWFAPRTKEIGWIFFNTAVGNGYCTEAARAVIKYAFEHNNVHRVVATCDPRNVSSKRVCEKLNMRQEAHFVKHVHYKDDIWWDELHYSILKEDFIKE